MKKHNLFLVGVLALGGLLFNQAAKAGQRLALHIQIPKEINTSNLTIIGGVYGRGLGIGPLDTKPSVYDYSLPLGSEAKSVKLLIYAPGYKMVTAEFGAKSLSSAKPFVPRFAKLPTTPLKLKLVDTNGESVVNEKITLGHDLATHSYFGYLDGMAYSASLLTANSDVNGEVDIQMPLLLEDPYFVKHSVAGLNISNGKGKFFSTGEQDFRPALVPLQKSYKQTITVTKIYRAKLSGKINQSFFRQHKVKGDITPYLDAKRYSPLRVEMRAQADASGAVYNCMLLNDGSFSTVLPTGTYNLHLVILGKGEELRKITVQQSVTLRENESRHLIIQ